MKLFYFSLIRLIFYGKTNKMCKISSNLKDLFMISEKIFHFSINIKYDIGSKFCL